MKRAPLTHDGVFADAAFAQRYAKKHSRMGERLGMRYAKVLVQAGFRNGRIIDVGCGPGSTAIVLARAFPDTEILGVDLSEPLLEVARKAASEAGVGGRAQFERADVQQLPYEDDTFDVAVNANVVHLVPDPVAMLNEIERVILPDGHLFITDLRRSWMAIFEREIRSGLTVDEARELFPQSNLRAGQSTRHFYRCTRRQRYSLHSPIRSRRSTGPV